MKNLSPISFFKFLFSYIKEIRLFLFYRKTVKALVASGELEKNGLRVDSLNRIFFVKNLEAEVLLYGNQEEGGLERFEKSFIAEQLRKYNDIFIKNQLIEIVKTSLKRIKTQDYYAYLVTIFFNFKKFTLLRTIYVLAYFWTLTYLIIKLVNNWGNIISYFKGLF